MRFTRRDLRDDSYVNLFSTSPSAELVYVILYFLMRLIRRSRMGFNLDSLRFDFLSLEKVIFPIDHRVTTIGGLEESSIWRGNDARNATDVTNRVIPFHLWCKPLVRTRVHTLYLSQFLSSR